MSILAEVLKLQRWAGGESISAAGIYQSSHRFESAFGDESKSPSNISSADTMHQ
jgi:hypothetical protein